MDQEQDEEEEEEGDDDEEEDEGELGTEEMRDDEEGDEDDDDDEDEDEEIDEIGRKEATVFVPAETIQVDYTNPLHKQPLTVYIPSLCLIILN